MFCRYADHLSNEHRILFQQVRSYFENPLVTAIWFKDDVIRRSINKQLPGLLPSLPADEETQECNCRKPFVKIERQPNLMLKYSSNNESKVVEMESSSTQTELLMAEVEEMVLNSKKQLETLEVAVQTLELEGGGFRVLESEMEKKLDSRQSAER